MPRAWIWLLSFLYLVMAVAFGAYEVIQNPFWKLDGHTIGQTIGGAIFIYGASAVVPLIAWGFARFRQHAAPAVFITWLVIGVVLAYFSDAGNRLDRTAKIGKLTSNPVFFRQGSRRLRAIAQAGMRTDPAGQSPNEEDRDQRS